MKVGLNLALRFKLRARINIWMLFFPELSVEVVLDTLLPVLLFFLWWLPIELHECFFLSCSAAFYYCQLTDMVSFFCKGIDIWFGKSELLSFNSGLSIALAFFKMFFYIDSGRFILIRRIVFVFYINYDWLDSRFSISTTFPIAFCAEFLLIGVSSLPKLSISYSSSFDSFSLSICWEFFDLYFLIWSLICFFINSIFSSSSFLSVSFDNNICCETPLFGRLSL